MGKPLLIYCSLILSIISCSKSEKKKIFEQEYVLELLEETDEEINDWHLKDYEEDSIVGISLEKAYSELLLEDSGEEIIVAILDTKLNIEHEDLKQQIYRNPYEISGNGIDDDHNGFVDDINGWNFIGYDKDKTIETGSTDHIKIIRKFQDRFKDIDSLNIPSEEIKNYRLYVRALRIKEEDLKSGDSQISYGETLIKFWNDSKEAFGDIVNDSLTREIWDSIIPKNDAEKRLKRFLNQFITYDFRRADFDDILKDGHLIKDSLNNVDYNERLLIGDNPEDYTDTDYGHGYVSDNDGTFNHSTQVGSIIAATRGNNGGIKGVSNKIRLMVLAISPTGDETDKDFYNAVKYACDNGAKVINYSSGKHISVNDSILKEAVKYAAEKDVLIVASAGNGSKNIDVEENIYYPIDYDESGEFTNNLIKVGSSGNTLNHSLYSPFSNYGKNNVDLFAPGQFMSVANSGKQKYINGRIRGTSLAAGLTSGVAAMLRSKYPKLSASEVKEILLNSSVKYVQPVKVANDTVPFGSLSKSGGILNAYNALKLAQENVEK